MYCIDPFADEPVMMLDKHIGFNEEDGQGINGAEFAKELLSLDAMGKKRIVVKINCPGGSVMDGMNIYNAILDSKTPVDTYNIGIAASMGAVCFMAGRKRYMSDYASLMVHNPSGSDDKQLMSVLTDSVATMLSAKSGLTEDAVKYLMAKTTWIKSSECLEKCFCTDVIPTNDQNRKYMPNSGAKAMWKAAMDIQNNALHLNDNNMKSVTAKLKLNDSANETAIVEAIDAIQNSLDTEVGKNKALTTELEEAKAKVAELEQAKADSDAKLKLVTDKAKEDADAALTEKSTAMVTAAAKLGKIKNDAATIKSWSDLAFKDFDGTKKLIEDLPINKVSNEIKIDAIDNKDAHAGSAAARMLEIQNKLAGK